MVAPAFNTSTPEPSLIYTSDYPLSSHFESKMTPKAWSPVLVLLGGGGIVRKEVGLNGRK